MHLKLEPLSECSGYTFYVYSCFDFYILLHQYYVIFIRFCKNAFQRFTIQKYFSLLSSILKGYLQRNASQLIILYTVMEQKCLAVLKKLLYKRFTKMNTAQTFNGISFFVSILIKEFIVFLKRSYLELVLY